ncbi:hypothetical protein FRAHR75_510024 [Frankia sp. Hr75.2]|nr:hypothetical protein FRAHR75_510024 [Frankia sp. Hr75.2]
MGTHPVRASRRLAVTRLVNVARYGRRRGLRGFGNGIDDGTTLRALTTDNCAPLWSGRVVHWGGSAAPFRVCHPGSVPAVNPTKTS